MNKGVTPHNYNLHSRFGPELLRQSDFMPPTYISTPKATAPQPSNDLPVTPTTSILLDATAQYTSPVTIYPPLTSLQTTQTYSTSIITTPSPAPIIISLTNLDSTTSLHLQIQLYTFLYIML
ncbi:hypothetical protein ACJMK2_027508 [Sinanodonta woodiana]|uniref:Uncharacterized protein n=1 Tax=Sinanodonta woodiana TaxID=1069815 RepID=A0ABD3XMZ9_SINWO